MSDFSTSDSSLASSSSDEDKKMQKKAKKGKDHKYKPEQVPAYHEVMSAPKYKKKGDDVPKTRCLAPPSDLEEPEYKPTPLSVPKDVGKIDEKTARDALLKYVDSQSCWRSGAAEAMELSNLKLSNAITYRCEVFVEVRKVKWKSAGHKKGEPIDPPKAGEAPLPWAMEAKPGHAWKKDKRKMEVPHSASVRKCWYCKGKGQVRCRQCKGKKYFECDSCSGSGSRVGPEGPQECGRCSGSGQCACSRCHAHGKYTCKTCSGHKKLKWHVQNMVKWEKHDEDKTFEETALPDELVSDVKGEVLFTDEQEILKPLDDFPEEHVVKFSRELLPHMLEKYRKEGRVLLVRHTVLATPVTEITWKHEDEGGKFFVYGLDKRVYFPDYPQQCCCALL